MPEGNLDGIIIAAPTPSSRLTNYLDVWVRDGVDRIYNNTHDGTQWLG